MPPKIGRGRLPPVGALLPAPARWLTKAANSLLNAQEEGLAGRLVGRMIRRSVRQRFHTVYWERPTVKIQPPAILVPNHHGWFDGYLMFHAVQALGLHTVDWIQEFDAFPLFAKIGGMPYPVNDPTRRARTVKRTIRLMREERRSLLLFAEARLHYPPDLLPFGRSLETVAGKVPDAHIFPVAIHYEMALHERPEAFIAFGTPIEQGEDLNHRTRDAVAAKLNELRERARSDVSGFEVLVQGTQDVNERWDMRRMRK